MITPTEEYINLDRRFRDLTKEEEIEPSLLASLGDWEHAQGTPWREILESERVVLLAEAGSGKTRELQAQAKNLVDQGKLAFFIPIEALDKQDLRQYLASEPGHAERFESWLTNPEGSTAWFFLDSVDELKLVQGKLEYALGKMTSALGSHSRRARIIVSCRPTDWQPIQDMEMFRRKLPESPDPIPVEKTGEELFLAPIRRDAGKDDKQEEDKKLPKFRCIVLLPLDRRRIEAYASARGVKNSKAFLEEIHRREAWSFARRPLDLQGLVDMWNEAGKIGTRLEQHENSIVNSLKDNPERPDNGVLSPEMARDGIERLALAMIMTKTRTIRSPEQTTVGNDAGSLDAASVLTGWTDTQVKALLRRPIFDPATYGRVRFHHRSIQEYLAAGRLARLQEQNLTKRQLKKLIFADTYGEKVVIPAMQAVSAWLSLWNRDVCREVIAREPEILVLHGDPESLSSDIRRELIQTYVSAYSKGSWRGLEMPVGEVQRLAHADLASDINKYLSQDHENEEVKEFLLKLVWLGGIRECADAAFQAAMDDKLDVYARSLAIKALESCARADLLRRVADDILANQSRWPDRIIHSAIDDLYPRVISTKELEILIRRTPESRNTTSGFAWTIYNGILDSLVGNEIQLNELKTLLTDLIWEGREKSRWYDPSSSFGYLAPVLTKLCINQIEKSGAISPALVRPCIIANRFQGDNYFGRDDLKKIREAFQRSPDIREAAFWAELEIMDSIEDNAGGGHRLYHALHDGLIPNLIDPDWDWLLRALKSKNDPDKREVALHGLLSLWFGRGRSGVDLKTLEKAVKNDANLEGILIERSKPVAVNAEEEKWQKQHQKRLEAQESKQRKIEQSWLDWKKEAESNPDRIFQGKRGVNSMWTLVKWLQHDGRDSGMLTRKSWPKIRKIMGDKAGELFENRMRAYWRKEKPPIWSRKSPEDRNTIFGSQYAALTGLSVEASIPDGFPKLSEQEVKRAAEWALTELNGFPEWFSDLGAKHPTAVAQVLNKELKAELAEADTVQYPHTLNALSYSSDQLKKLVAPYLKRIILKWPAPAASGNNSIRSKNLHDVLSIILSENTQDKEIADLCEEKFLEGPGNEEATIWLHGLCACDLKRGVTAFQKGLKKIAKKKRQSRAVAWIGTIFNNRYREKIAVNLDADTDVLMSLTELAYECVRREDDIHHEGVYSPGDRDKAEDARNRILGDLIGKSGTDAHDALIKLAAKPLFSHMPDRLRILARQRAAKDSDIKTFSVTEFKEWEKKYEFYPQNRDDLFEIMMNRLDDIDHDIRHHDFTDRATLAKITDETEMQPLLAKKVLDHAKGHYEVVREDEVADKKETDIRLLAGAAGRAVIEVKIGDNNWSVKQLEEAIEKQLVGQYLRHESCTVGILLITYAGGKGFEHPQTKKPMPFEDVIAHLKNFAQTIETKESGRVRLGVMGLDLRNPLTNKSGKNDGRKKK